MRPLDWVLVPHLSMSPSSFLPLTLRASFYQVNSNQQTRTEGLP